MKNVGIIVLLIALALCGCSEQQEDQTSAEQAKIDVSLGFDSFPQEYTCDGDDISPPIEISNLHMENAQSMSVVVKDPDAPGGTFIHWVMWNIEPANTIPADIPPQGDVSNPITAVQGKNSFGKVGYSGPCPPQGEEHTYEVEVYVLKKKLDLPPGSTSTELEDAWTGYVSQYGEAKVNYSR